MESRNYRRNVNWSVITAANDDRVLKLCLLNSPGIESASEVLVQRGYSSAAVAYNAAIEQASTDLLVLVHQDIYLPENWIQRVQSAVEQLAQTCPDWGVLGCCGIQTSGKHVGYIYDGAWNRVLGEPFEGGLEVESLDEAVLIIRKSSGLRFDPSLEGFHMYGADVCLQAQSRGKKCYAIGAFCIHNTNPYRMLPLHFWKGYLAMRRKWKAQLPIKTTCTEITYSCWPMVRWNIVRALNLATGRDSQPVRRVDDPSRLYHELKPTLPSAAYALSSPCLK